MAEPTEGGVSSNYEAQLVEFSACEISDAVLALEAIPSGEVRHGGYLEGIRPLRSTGPSTGPVTALPTRIAAPAYPVTLADVSEGKAWRSPDDVAATWSDCCPAGHLVLLIQPAHQRCAALGGIHAARLCARGCAGVVVAGRVRDRGEIAALIGSSGGGKKDDAEEVSEHRHGTASFTAWTRGYSIVGQGAEAHIVAMGEEASVDGVRVASGDYVLCDFEEDAVVRVPRELVPRVIAWAKLRKVQDEQALQWVTAGGGVGDAFKRFRSKIVI